MLRRKIDPYTGNYPVSSYMPTILPESIRFSSLRIFFVTCFIILPLVYSLAQEKGGPAGEGLNYYQLYKDQKLWNATAELRDQIDVFDQVVKIVDEYINMDGGFKDIDAFKNNMINRGNMVNFILDGSTISNSSLWICLTARR